MLTRGMFALVAATVCVVVLGGVTGASVEQQQALLERPATLPGIIINIDVPLADLRATIAESGLDPLVLPSDEGDFTFTLFNTTVNGSVWLGDGRLTGLSTVHATGNISAQMKVFPPGAEVTGRVGLTGLQIQYSVEVKLGPIPTKFSIEIEVPLLSLDFVADVLFAKRSVAMKDCGVNDFGYSTIALKGLGLLDTPFYNLVGNGLLELLNGKVAEVVGEVVCGLLERKLQSVDILNM